jgi:SNF2 family DNA or RNA helicase
VLDILQAAMEKFGCLRIDGRVSPTNRQQKVDHFIKQPNIRVMLGNIQSIGTGTDGLQEVCSHAIFTEQSWVHGENQQGVDRLDRGGQTHTVLADFLVAPGSLGERILSGALRKGRQTHQVLDNRVHIK